MADSPMPSNLVPSGGTPVFNQDTIPDALQKEHRLAEGNWGLLNVLGGKIRYVDLESLEEEIIAAPGHVTIRPEAPHRVAIEGPVEFKIDFYREPQPGTESGATA